jgi:hypothetical protein
MGIFIVRGDVGGFYLCSTMWGVYNNHPPGSGSFWGYPLAILINNFKKLLIKISFCCSKKTLRITCCAACLVVLRSLRSLAHYVRLLTSQGSLARQPSQGLSLIPIIFNNN